MINYNHVLDFVISLKPHFADSPCPYRNTKVNESSLSWLRNMRVCRNSSVRRLLLHQHYIPCALYTYRVVGVRTGSATQQSEIICIQLSLAYFFCDAFALSELYIEGIQRCQLIRNSTCIREERRHVLCGGTKNHTAARRRFRFRQSAISWSHGKKYNTTLFSSCAKGNLYQFLFPLSPHWCVLICNSRIWYRSDKLRNSFVNMEKFSYVHWKAEKYRNIFSFSQAAAFVLYTQF